MTTRGISLRRKDTLVPALPSDALRTELPVARRDTILQALEVLKLEATDVTLTRSERRELRGRINKLRNLLGWPAL
jgi:hypothetical protein